MPSAFVFRQNEHLRFELAAGLHGMGSREHLATMDRLVPDATQEASHVLPGDTLVELSVKLLDADLPVFGAVPGTKMLLLIVLGFDHSPTKKAEWCDTLPSGTVPQTAGKSTSGGTPSMRKARLCSKPKRR